MRHLKSNLCKYIVSGLLWLGFTSGNATIIYGHRGARGLMPENSLPGFEMALKQGVDYVDLDIAMTKDGVLVVQHDLILNPDLTRDAKGTWVIRPLIVKNMTLNQIQTYDVGKIKPNTAYAKLFRHQKSVEKTKISTLKEVIEYVKKEAGNRVGFQIEIKTDPTAPNISVSSEQIVAALDQLIREEQIVSRTKVQAFDWQSLLLLQKLNKDVITGYLTSLEQEKSMKNPDPRIAGKWTGGFLLKNYSSLPQMIQSLGGDWWDAQDIEINQKNLEEAHRQGLKVAAWSWPERTGKEVDRVLINRLIALKVDGIITDRPDLFAHRTRASNEVQ